MVPPLTSSRPPLDPLALSRLTGGDDILFWGALPTFFSIKKKKPKFTYKSPSSCLAPIWGMEALAAGHWPWAAWVIPALSSFA